MNYARVTSGTFGTIDGNDIAAKEGKALQSGVVDIVNQDTGEYLVANNRE